MSVNRVAIKALNFITFIRLTIGAALAVHEPSRDGIISRGHGSLKDYYSDSNMTIAKT